MRSRPRRHPRARSRPPPLRGTRVAAWSGLLCHRPRVRARRTTRMFHHHPRLQYNARPDRPDPLFARQLQEVLGGQWGEISVMMSYLFQGWNCRGPAKYRDMLLDIGTEEIAHVEMLATMVCRLLEGASSDDQRAAADGNGLIAGMLGGTSPKDMIMAAAMNPQHAIMGGLGAVPSDSVDNRWTSAY